MLLGVDARPPANDRTAVSEEIPRRAEPRLHVVPVGRHRVAHDVGQALDVVSEARIDGDPPRHAPVVLHEPERRKTSGICVSAFRCWCDSLNKEIWLWKDIRTASEKVRAAPIV